MRDRDNQKKMIAVVGPTASGKSDLAVDIARYIIKEKDELGVNGAEIISADSRQVYKEFNLSSGKITPEEMKGVPHHLLDITSPTTSYTVAHFQRDARQIIQQLHNNNIIPILCGGTAFWIDSVLYNTSIPSIPPNVPLRKKLKDVSTKDLFALLQKKDLQRAATIDPHNPHRLIRALEIVEAIGKVPPLSHTTTYATLVLGIQTEKEQLADRINKRLETRIQEGMIEEIANIHHNGVSYKRLEELGLEFRWTARYLQGTLSLSDMKQHLVHDIIAYAKRQMTWLKRNKEIVWIPNNVNNAWPLVKKLLE